MMNIITEKINKKLSATNKAIINTVLKTIDIKSNENVLEIAKKHSITELGFFDNIGCNVDCLVQNNYKFKQLTKRKKYSKATYLNGSIEDLTGGQYDYIFLYNNKIENIKIEQIKLYAFEKSKIIILNTQNLINNGCLNNIKNKLKLDASILNTDQFSLMIILV